MRQLRIGRVRGRRAAQEVLRRGVRSRDSRGQVVVIALRREDTDAPSPVGVMVIVPRSLCPRAVGRNRLRRLLRESIRMIARSDPALLAPYRAVAVRWLQKPPRDCKRLRLWDVLPSVKEALEGMQ